MRQLLMFPDPRPLVERLGREFFRQVPEVPGVYLMRDAAEAVLYVGKAKNLRKRLNAYRVANPDRMARRHLRMLRAVVRIDLEECANEVAALARESELLLSLRPRFNRAGTWRGPNRFLHWRRVEETLEMAVTEAAQEGWRGLGPLNSRTLLLRSVLIRMLWIAVHPERGFLGMPAGWAHDRFDNPITLRTGGQTDAVVTALDALSSGDTSILCNWVHGRTQPPPHPLQRTVLEEDLAWLADRFEC
jgi:hypothetical protein